MIEWGSLIKAGEKRGSVDTTDKFCKVIPQAKVGCFFFFLKHKNSVIENGI